MGRRAGYAGIEREEGAGEGMIVLVEGRSHARKAVKRREEAVWTG